MKGYIPLEKRSKKEQRRVNAARRGDWNGVVPVTKTIPNKKKAKQNRKDYKKEALESASFCCLRRFLFNPLDKSAREDYTYTR